MAKIVKYVGLANLVWLAGCGGTQPQPSMMGSGMDPLASSGSLGTGSAKGNILKKQPDLGIDGNLNGFKIFDDNSFWDKNVEKTAVDPSSAKYIAAIGADKTLVANFGASGTDKLPFGTPYVVVSADAPRVPITFTETKGSDAGPYPFPLQMPLEAGKESDAIVIDRDQQKLYEATGVKADGTNFDATSGAVWDLRTYTARKVGQLAADPSGLPIFPGLVRFEEASDPKGINHVLRFTLAKVSKSFVAPAIGSSGTTTEGNLPPMGLHLRLKKSINITKFPTTIQPILAAMKKFGMVLSDTGTDMGISGAPDAKWIDGDLASFKNLKVSDFEAIVPPPPPKLTKKQQAAADAAAVAAQAAAASSTATATPAATPAAATKTSP